ncbi:hypothetical protein AALB53_08230 [Lachnospiraceae bacterium 47-T17]
MAQLNLDAKLIEESYGVIKQVSNAGIIDATNDLAQVLLPEEGSNALCDELLGHCRAFQAEYNGNYVASVGAFMKSYENLIDISEYLEKQATVGDVTKVDTGFKAGGIDAGAVKM